MLEDQQDVDRRIEARRSEPGETRTIPEAREGDDRKGDDHASDDGDDAGEGANGEPDPDAEGRSKPNILRRHPFWALGIAVAVLALAAGAYVYWLTRLHPFESTDDAFVDARQFSIAPKVAGYIVDAPVTDNQHVEAGTVLFRIDPRDYEVALAQARAQVASAEAAIANYVAQIEGQKAQIEASRATADTVRAQVGEQQAALAQAQAQSDAAQADIAFARSRAQEPLTIRRDWIGVVVAFRCGVVIEPSGASKASSSGSRLLRMTLA